MLGTPTKHVEDFDISKMPKGCLQQFWVSLVSDCFSQFFSVPVLVAKGEKAGPVFGVTAVLHGNELNGIPVIHQFLNGIDLKKLSGVVVGVVVVNTPGFFNSTRNTYEQFDLNHVMPGKYLGDFPQQYAHQFMERIIRKLDYLVDLHTASFGRINSLYVRADLCNEITAQMAKLQAPEIIVHNPPSDRTLRGAAMQIGIPTITIEIGAPLVFQSKYLQRSVAGLRRALADIGMIPMRLPEAPRASPLICSHSYWVYTDVGGLVTVFPGLVEILKKGAILASMKDIFGNHVKDYHMLEDGVIIGKNVNPAGHSGARIAHIGILERGAFKV